MTSKILKSILSVAITVLLASLLVVTGVLYQYFASIQHAQLKDQLSLAAGATNTLGQEYLDSLATERYRLTWVAEDGTVLYDSHVDASSMGNHADREEILEAIETGSGSSARRSSTQTEQTLYEAVRLNDGSVLRISVSRATAGMLVLDMVPQIGFIAILVIIFSAWLAKRMAAHVVEPLNQLNLEHPMDNDAYEELSPLLCRIHDQHQEIKQQMQTLRRKQEEFDQITGNMKEALVLLDTTGKIVSINPAGISLLGTDPHCIGEDLLTINRSKNIRIALQEVYKTGQASFHSNLNGRDYLFDLSLIDSAGTARGIVLLAFDVTERINAERNRREFTANVSHELKTPLQSIIGSAEIIENGIVKPEDIPRFIGHIHKEASRLVSLIEDIIRLSQLDEGQEMPLEPVSLHALAAEICETLESAGKQKHVSLSVSGDAGMVQGVKRLLFEVIYNLCDNAVKYNREGGSVIVTITKHAYDVSLCVEDTGIGIAPEHQEKVFERFYRVDKSHSKQSGGTGLGLSIVKHAVQYHHGTIKMDSEFGKGTAITITFPTAQSSI